MNVIWKSDMVVTLFGEYGWPTLEKEGWWHPLKRPNKLQLYLIRRYLELTGRLVKR